VLWAATHGKPAAAVMSQTPIVAPPLHLPALQVCPLPHAMPHAPQLVASVIRLLHVPEQSVWPLAQAHWPALQVCPLPHAMPHVPQLAASVIRLLHVPEQSV
jgi:hypothetical protein